MDVHQKSLHNNSFLEEIMKIKEEFLNVPESQINPSEFEIDVNYGTFELTPQKTIKKNSHNNYFQIEKLYNIIKILICFFIIFVIFSICIHRIMEIIIQRIYFF